MNKEERSKRYNPEKYRMACCPSCRGTGKSSHEEESVKVCNHCGGFGWVKKENELRKGGKNESNHQ